jgi:methylated-DNA-protein-cysteine methyltransferase-like protein
MQSKNSAERMRFHITKQEEQKSQVWHAVSKIPFGRVATYKQIATLAGLPRHARFVGHCLRLLPAGSKLPWHRVANSKKQLSFPIGSEKYNKQLSLLAKEGVFFNNDRHNSLWMPNSKE